MSEQKSIVEKKTLGSKLLLVAGWIWSSLFLLVSLGHAVEGGLIQAVTYFFAGVLLLPPLATFLKVKLGLRIPGTAKAVIIVAAVIASGAATRTPTRSTAVEDSNMKPVDANAPLQVPDYVKENCQTLENMFGANSSLSELQQQEAWANYRGKAFKWKLQVTEVQEGLLDGYLVSFKCVPSRSFISDVNMKFGKEAKAAVIKLQKGAVYEVKGILSDYSRLVGLQAVPLQ